MGTEADTPLDAPAGASLSRCPRCGGEFHCGIHDPAPCACTRLRVSSETLRALRAQYNGCLCIACLQELSSPQPTDGRPRTLAFDRTLDAGTAALMPLAIVVTVLLFLQWPLRDLVGGGSTQVNDLAQWLFACYVALSLRHASGEHAHLTARGDLAASCDPTSPQRSRWRSIGGALCLLPWALALLVFDAPAAWHSLQLAERFPETNNPGYFMTHVALIALALLAIWQSARDLWRATRPTPDAPPAPPPRGGAASGPAKPDPRRPAVAPE